MLKRTKFCLLFFAVVLTGRERKTPPPTALEQYIATVKGTGDIHGTSSGSLYSVSGRLGDLTRDLRASQVGDLVTIVVNDRASAVSQGSTSSSRKSSANASIPALFGPIRGPALTNLANLGSEMELEGEGSTSRSNVLTATLTARVVDVLPNGYLIVEGIKDVQANSEKQRITVRGVVRWNDISPSNTVRSDRVGQMEIRVDGKGVISDATRRPNILYRLLLGVLPF